MARAYAYTDIKALEEDEVVYYPAGTDVTNKFSKEQLEEMLANGSVALYDRTQTPEQGAEVASALAEENQHLKEQLEALKAQSSTVDADVANAYARAKVAEDTQKENDELKAEVAELQKRIAAKEAEEAQKSSEAASTETSNVGEVQPSQPTQ